MLRLVCLMIASSIVQGTDQVDCNYDYAHHCLNGGSCIPNLDYANNSSLYFCDCSATLDANGNPYVGKYCEYQSLNTTVCNDTGDVYCINGKCNPDYPQYGLPCNCETGYTGYHCEYMANQVPDCTLDCQNGGYCVLGGNNNDGYQYWNSDTGSHMSCQCDDNHDGTLCEIQKVACGDIHCFNGGTCVERVVDGLVFYNCDCRTAVEGNTFFAGRFCQFASTTVCDQQAGIFCTNGGQCQSDAHLGCDCANTGGYSGFSCEFYTPDDYEEPYDMDDDARPIVDPTDAMVCNLDCQNGGTCRKGAKDIGILQGTTSQNVTYLNSSYNEDFEHCVCPAGWVGIRCEYSIQVCGADEHYCLHGSQCVSNGELHACDCSTTDTKLSNTFMGVFCEQQAGDICTQGDPQPGQSISFCVNGGTCIKKVNPGEAHPGCNCLDGWTGPHCELRQGSDQSATDKGNAAGSGSSNKGKAGTVFFTLLFIAAIAGTGFVLRSYLRRRRLRHQNIPGSLRWAGDYSDHAPEINLAPRRGSSLYMKDEIYAANIATSSTDPMTTNLSPNKPDLLDDGDPQPQIYLGPPRDEDGHELHDVDVC